jgi:RNA polymerase sigma-70 factor (ECF subfamily)
MIKRIATAYEARPHLAEELVQEIYFAIWLALPSFRAEASIRTCVAHCDESCGVSCSTGHEIDTAR